MGVVEAEDADALLAERVEVVVVDLLDLEELAQALAEAALALRVVGEAGEQAVGGEDREAGVVEPGQRHQRVVVGRPRRRPRRGRRSRSRSGGGRRRSAAGRRRAASVIVFVDAAVADPPDPGHGAVVVGRLAPGLFDRGLLGDQRPGVDRCSARRSARGCSASPGSVRAGPAWARAGCARGAGPCRCRSPRPGPGRGCRGGCGEPPSGPV